MAFKTIETQAKLLKIKENVLLHMQDIIISLNIQSYLSLKILQNHISLFICLPNEVCRCHKVNNREKIDTEDFCGCLYRGLGQQINDRDIVRATRSA